MDLLTKTRRINVLLQKAAGKPVNFKEMSETLSEVIEANVFVLSRRGKLLGFAINQQIENDRMKKMLREVKADGNIILFLDEIHTIIGAGSSDNSLDIANIIKPYLVRDNFRCIGATTTEEYQKSIYKDKALARRFQPIFVDELSE